VHRYELADAAGGGRASIRSRLNGTDVPTYEYGHIARADVLLANQHNVSGFHHRVSRLDRADEAFAPMRPLVSTIPSASAAMSVTNSNRIAEYHSTAMPRVFLLSCVLALGIAGAAGCRPAPDAEPPVATPSVTVSRTDVPVGSPIDMEYRFVVAPNVPALAEDYSVFVHFLDSDGELMWTDDHQPPTPVRQWRPGSTVQYSRTMFVPKFPYVGETTVHVGLYSPASGNRLPLAGETEGQREYRVAAFNLHLQTDNVFVVFREGWHPTEITDDGQEWQWSRQDATLTFRNPKRDVEFFLQLDQPIETLKEPRNVSVRLGPAVVESFVLPPGERQLRRFGITADQLGAGDTVEMGISVDKTFIPASVPELRSSDPRELGVRVFRAFVQPK
jgi:hypothetical protein